MTADRTPPTRQPQPGAGFTPAPPMSMGLRRHSAKNWTDGPWLGGLDPLGITGLYARQMAEKNRLLDERRQEVFALHKQAEAAARETAILICDSAAISDAPDQPSNQPPQMLSGKASDQFLSACRLIPEDILLVVPEKGAGQNQTQWRLRGATLAFPSHWQLGDKMGKTLAELHSSVPEFSQRLAGPVNRFFDTMQAAHISWRQNWSVQTDDRLFAPDREEVNPEKLTADQAGDHIFIRIETQHFYKLPTSGAVIFAIRTSLAPLSFWQDNPAPIAALVGQINQLPEKMQEYKAIDKLRPALCHWLDNR